MNNQQLAENFYKAFDSKQPELLDDVLTEDWKALPAVPGNLGGLEGQKGTVYFLNSVFSNFSYKVLEIIDSGTETVVARAQLSGIQVGEFLGVPPTNRKIIMDTIEVHKVKDGKIYTTYHIEDFFGAYMQMTGNNP